MHAFLFYKNKKSPVDWSKGIFTDMDRACVNVIKLPAPKVDFGVCFEGITPASV